MKKRYNITHILITLIIAVFTINYAINNFSSLKKQTSAIEQLSEVEVSESDVYLKSHSKKIIYSAISFCFDIQFGLEKALHLKNSHFYKSINSPHGFHLPVFLDNSKLLI